MKLRVKKITRKTRRKKTIEIKGMPSGDDNNIKHIFNLTSNKLLSEILLQNIDIKYYVKRELAMRGRDQNGKWIGFDNAFKLHRIVA